MIRLDRLFFVLMVLSMATLSAIPTASAQPDVLGQWNTGPNLPYFPVHVHALPDGRVMLWPGDQGISGNDPRVWDPATGQLSVPVKPGYDVFCSGHAFMADGQLFVAGGHVQNDVGLPKASRYNPVTDTWTAMPDMNAGRWYPSVTALSNGDMLVASGSIDTTQGVNTLPQVFQAATGTWRDLSNARLALDLYPTMLLAPNGKVFLVGPSATTRYLDTDGAGAWSVVASRGGGYRDYGSAVMYGDGKVLTMGGGDPPLNSAEVIDLNAAVPTWRAVAPMQYARKQLNALLLPDGRVLVTGGTSGPGFNNTATPVFPAELWDPVSEQWTTLASATIPRLYHSATVLLSDGRVLSTGGNGYPQAEVFSPPYLFKGARPTISAAPTTVAYGQTFFVGSPEAASISSITLLRLSSTTHAFNMNQRINRLGFSIASDGLNVVAPTSPNLTPPGDYMLFILNGQGVPSEARIVRIGGTPAPAPMISTLSPSTATASGSAFVLTVDGGNFVPGATVLWNGESRTTTFVSGTRVTASIRATDIATTGTATVTVRNPDLQTSNGRAFTIAPATTGGCTTGQFSAEYFSNVTLTGPPVRTACEAAVNYDFGLGGPSGLPVDNFSARWTGRFAFAAGSVAFTARADDGVRVFLDGVQIIDGWRDQPATTYTATRTVTAGEHEVKIEFYDRLEDAVIQVSWVAAAAAAAPALTTLTPSGATAGGAAFTLTVDGTNFVTGATVLWNGAPRTTSFVSGTRVTAAIPAADIGVAGSATVTVRNPDLQVSNALPFAINSSASGCTTGQFLAQYFNNIGLTGKPTRTACETTINYDWGAGGPAGLPADNFSVRWTGRFAFAAGNVTFTARADDGVRVFIDGVLIIDGWLDQLPTTYTAVRAVTTGEHEVKVEYYEHSAGALVQVSWTAGTVPTPTVTTLTPSTAMAGSPAFTLHVAGSNFESGSAVRWNGAARTTTFVSATQLDAAIAATDIASPGTASVTVANPTTGAVSNGAPFVVTTGVTTFTLTVTKSGNGSVTSAPAGITCGADCSEAYPAGTVVTLTAIPGKNQQFAGWSGACSGTGVCTITMDGAKTVGATFKR